MHMCFIYHVKSEESDPSPCISQQYAFCFLFSDLNNTASSYSATTGWTLHDQASLTFPISSIGGASFISPRPASLRREARSTFPRWVAASMGRRNTGLKFIGWRLEPQRLSRP